MGRALTNKERAHLAELAKGRFDSRVIPTKDLVAFVEKLESKDCYNVAWAEARY